MDAPETIANQSPGSMHAKSAAPIQQVRVDVGGVTLAIVASLVVVIGACGAVIGVDVAERRHEIDTLAQLRATEVTRERETRMLEYYVTEVDGKLENAGIISSKESWATRKGRKP